MILYSNIWGKLSFVGSDIKLKGFNGLYGNAKIENLDGYINGLAGKGHLQNKYLKLIGSQNQPW